MPFTFFHLIKYRQIQYDVVQRAEMNLWVFALLKKSNVNTQFKKNLKAIAICYSLLFILRVYLKFYFFVPYLNLQVENNFKWQKIFFLQDKPHILQEGRN